MFQKVLQYTIARPVNMPIALAIKNYDGVRTMVRTRPRNLGKSV